MWTLSTIAKRIARVALVAAIVAASVTPAAAACMSRKPANEVTASVRKPPCNMPCQDCFQRTMESCQRDCVAVTTGFLAPLDAGAPAFPDARVDPVANVTAHALLHPPDTPPPRSLLALF